MVHRAAWLQCVCVALAAGACSVYTDGIPEHDASAPGASTSAAQGTGATGSAEGGAAGTPSSTSSTSSGATGGSGGQPTGDGGTGGAGGTGGSSFVTSTTIGGGAAGAAGTAGSGGAASGAAGSGGAAGASGANDSGTPDGPCVVESDDAFCTRQGKNCGTVAAPDNCGTNRMATCGICGPLSMCAGGGTANVCGAPPNLAQGGMVTASNAGVSPEDMSKAFDNDALTKWFAGGVTTPWIAYAFAAGAMHTVTSYAVTSANDAQDRDPSGWQLQGSNTGATWTTIDTRTGEMFANRFQTNFYTCTNATSYKRYRFLVTANNGSPDFQVAEIQLFGN